MRGQTWGTQMTRISSSHYGLLVPPLLLLTACGSEAASSPGETDGVQTDGALSDTDGSTSAGTTQGESGSDGSETSAGPSEPPAPIRILYPSEQGLTVREAVGGEIGAPQVFVPGAWQFWLSYGHVVARALEGPGRIAGPWTGQPLQPTSLECPDDDQCSAFPVGESWMSAQSTPDLMGTDYFVFENGPDGPTSPSLLYGSEQGSPRGFFGDRYLVVVEPLDDGAQVARITLEPGASPEPMFEVAATAEVWFSSSVPDNQAFVLVTDPAEQGWRASVQVADALAPTPVAMDVPLLSGAVAHGYWSPVMHPEKTGMILVQGDREQALSAGDLVWVPLQGSGFGDPQRISTGMSEGAVANSTAAPTPIAFSPGGTWLAFRARPVPDEPSETFLVRWNDGAPGDPILLDQQAYGVEFSSDGGQVFFLGGPDEERYLARASLDGGVLGDAEVLLQVEEPGYFAVSEDTSSVAMVNLDRTQLWTLDLETTPASSRSVAECGDTDVSFKMASDGSLVACSWGESLQADRTHVLVNPRTGEATPLEATYGAQLVTLER